LQDKILSEIMKNYSQVRDANQKKIAKRKEDLYLKNPEFKKIDQELIKTHVAISKLILSHANNFDLEKLKAKNQELLSKREKILRDLNLDKNYFVIYNCSKCHDTGYINQKKCVCLTQKLIEKYYELSNIKNLSYHESFGEFNFKYYSNNNFESKSPLELIKRAFNKSLDFVNNFEKKYLNLLFYGNTGLGKTFLCNCIAREILNKSHSVLYLTAPQLFKIFSKIRFDQNNCTHERELYELLFEIDLLILDDLGSEFATLHSDLFDVLNSRIISRKHVIISTNLAPEYLDKNYGSRIFSRLVGNYVFFKFIGDDIRQIKFKI